MVKESCETVNFKKNNMAVFDSKFCRIITPPENENHNDNSNNNNQFIDYEADLVTFLESIYAKQRRGVVISLGIDQLRSTVLIPASYTNDWDIRSYGLFQQKRGSRDQC